MAGDMVPANKTIWTNTEFPDNIGDYHSQAVTGWFVPPETTRYRFYMSCDDHCQFKMGTGEGQPGTVPAFDDMTNILHQNYVLSRR